MRRRRRRFFQANPVNESCEAIALEDILVNTDVEGVRVRSLSSDGPSVHFRIVSQWDFEHTRSTCAGQAQEQSYAPVLPHRYGRMRVGTAGWRKSRTKANTAAETATVLSYTHFESTAANEPAAAAQSVNQPAFLGSISARVPRPRCPCAPCSNPGNKPGDRHEARMER